MKVNITTFFKVIFIIAVQLLVDRYLNLGVYIHISILPILILSFSYRYNTIAMMLIAFGLGLSVDIFGNGVIGLNTAALVAVAFTRKTFLRLLVNQKSIEKLSAPSAKEIGLVPYFMFLLFSYLIFFIIYIPFEWMSIYPIFQSLIKLTLCTAVNIIIAYIFGGLFQNKK